MKNQELYSIRMRAAIGGRHELGGKHISGGEQLSTKSEIIQKAQELIEKALSHQRGEPDFLQVSIEKVTEAIHPVQPLSVLTHEVVDEIAGLELAKSLLMDEGLNENVINKGLWELTHNMEARGAILIDAHTGKRLDDRGLKGIRVSRIDWDKKSYDAWLRTESQLQHIKVKEALALATKVASHSFTVAELCWSDDPDYVTGYVASCKNGYQRITKLKKQGVEVGGRVYFIQPPSKNDIFHYIDYLEKSPIILKLPHSPRLEGHNHAIIQK